MNVCRICRTPIKGKGYKLRDGATHRECRRMQNRGLLNTGGTFTRKDSTGQPCGACRDPIDGPHAHRQGTPFHRECLT